MKLLGVWEGLIYHVMFAMILITGKRGHLHVKSHSEVRCFIYCLTTCIVEARKAPDTVNRLLSSCVDNGEAIQEEYVYQQTRFQCSAQRRCI